MNEEFSEKDIKDCYECTGKHPAYWEGYSDRTSEENYNNDENKEYEK